MILYVYNYQEVKRDLILAWFVGVAVGIIFGAWINTKFSKRSIYVSDYDYEKCCGDGAAKFIEFQMIFFHFSSHPQYFVAVDIVCVSVLFICSPQSEYNFLLVGRALTGVLFGITLLTTVVHTADNASQFVRRYLLWTIVIINLLPSILLAEAASFVFGIDGGLNVAIGLMMLLFSVLAMIVMPCTYESIMYLLDSGKDLKALEILLKLRNESRHFIRNDFNDMKVMIAEDRNSGANILRHGNWRPLLLILLIRLLSPLLANNIVASVSIMNIWLDHQRVTMQQTHEAASLTVLSSDMSDTTMNYTSPYEIDAFTQMTTDTFESIENATETMDSTTFDSNGDLNFTFSEYLFHEENLTHEWTTSTTTEFDNTTASVLTVDDVNELYFIHSAYEYKPCILDAQYILLFIFVVKLIVGMPLMCWAESLYIYRNRFIFKATLTVAILNLTFCALSWCSYILEDNVLIFTYYMFKLQNIINGLFVVVAFAIDIIGLNELAEGFSSAKRTGSIAFVLTIEYLVHLLYFMPLVMFHHLPFYLNFVHWSVIIGISYLLIWLMPNDGLDKTLRDARDKYFISLL